MKAENIAQAGIIAVLVLGGGLALWLSVVRPQMNATSRGQLAIAEKQIADLRTELAQASSGGQNLEPGGLRALTTSELQTERGRLIDEVQKLGDRLDVATEERNRVENELAEFTVQLEEGRSEKQSIDIESRVLKAENERLINEVTSLQRNVRALSRDILVKADQREKLDIANELLTQRLANQRAAFSRLAENFLTIVDQLKRERERLLAGQKTVEEARLDFQEGLDDLAFEFKKISSRNVGRIRTRYSVLSRDRKNQADVLGTQEVKLELGEDTAEQTSDRIRNNISVFGIIGKTARIMFSNERQETAVRVQELLREAGLIVDAQLAPEFDLETQKDRIFYYSDDNEDSADQLTSIILDADVGDYESELLDDTANQDFVVWIIGTAEAESDGDGPDGDGPDGDSDGAGPDGDLPSDNDSDGAPSDLAPPNTEDDGDALPPDASDGDGLPPDTGDGDSLSPETGPDGGPAGDGPPNDFGDVPSPDGDVPPPSQGGEGDDFERDLERELEEEKLDAPPAANGQSPEATFSQ